MVRFENPSSSSSTARGRWRYDRLPGEEIDDIEAEESHASGTAVETFEGEMEHLPRGTAARKSEEAITYVFIVGLRFCFGLVQQTDID
jgi:hypothetical protein